MVRNSLNNQGRALTELLLVMIMLLFFGTASFVMVVGGQQASQQLITQQQGLSEVRTAYAYLNTRLRQHDEREMVSVRPHPKLKATALVIEEEYNGTRLETWIYLSQGYLREVLVFSGDPIDDDVSYSIARIEAFDLVVENDGQTLQYAVTSGTGEETVRRRGVYRLKTDQHINPEFD